MNAEHDRDVLLAAGAEQDLESIYDYIQAADGQARADHVLSQLLKVTASLSHAPERGRYPSELKALGIQEYRQVYFKPYRVIYRIMDVGVVIYLIADGRRDMQSLLMRRLLLRD